MMFETVDPRELNVNFTALMNDRKALLTAADGDGCNTMTIGWGSAGILWRKPVVTVYVRPQRYTYGLMEQNDYFSVNFMPENAGEILNLCGTRSGRDMDKISACALTVRKDQPAPYFEEAELNLICRKLYAQDMEPGCFTDGALDSAMYPEHDYHRVYVGEIVAALKKKA